MKLFPTALSGGRHRYCTRWSASCLSKRSMSSVCHCSRKCAMAACWPQHMLATKRRCCCVSQPEADKQTDSRPAAVAMRVCVCGGGARVSQAAVSTRGSIMNIHDTPIPSNLQLDTYTDTHTLWMMVTMVIRAHLSLLHLVRTLSLPLKLHYFSLSVLVRVSHQPVEIHTLMFYSSQFSVTWRVWILWGFFLGLSVRLHTGWCSTLWLVKITLRPTLHHHHVNMVLFPFVVVHIPLCCWR